VGGGDRGGHSLPDMEGWSEVQVLSRNHFKVKCREKKVDDAACCHHWDGTGEKFGFKNKGSRSRRKTIKECHPPSLIKSGGKT